MIIIDTLLEKRRDNPIRVGISGAGLMGRGVSIQIETVTTGMTLVAFCVRNPDAAGQMLSEQLPDREWVQCDSSSGMDAAIAAGKIAITSDIAVFAGTEQLDAVVDATGAIEWGAQLASACIEGGKHLVLMNAEMDATLGAILATRAEAAGVVYTGCDGDQPGVQMNLIRFVRGIGLTPLVVGNIKGLQDNRRNPTTQIEFAKQWDQKPKMVASFADSTKVSAEQALVANAAGLTIAKRGMLGLDHPDHVDTLTTRYDLEELQALGGIVDYTVGSKPAPGVFCLATIEDPRQRRYLKQYKLGDGPLYSLYTPWHLCHFEVPNSVARAALLADAAIRPLGAPRVELVATAKTDLSAGTVLDGFGGYHSYGEAETAEITHRDGLLPMGLAEDCVLIRDIAVDQPIHIVDVVMPRGLLAHRLRREQDVMFFGSSALPEA